jgi:hypothetical protein
MTAEPGQSGREIVQQMVFSRKRATSGEIRFELEYELDDSVVELRVTLPENIEIERATGFTAAGDEWRWESGPTDPVLTGTYHTNTTRSNGARYVDAGEWAIIKPPTHAASWRYRGRESLDFVETYEVADTGIASSNGALVLLGDHEQRHHSALGQRYTLTIPQAAELAVDPEEIFAAITDAADYLDVGESPEDILLVAAPSEQAEWGPLGTQTGDDGIWALDRCLLDRPNTTWIHEYVHTRQAPRCESSMQWFVEGTACYYATLCSIRRGDVDFDTGQRFLDRTRTRDATLTEPGTWPSGQIKYVKGRRVTAALDCEIRRHTDGEEDLRTVWATLNETFETADFGAFQTALEEAIPDPEPLLAWTDRYVDGSDVPSLPTDPSAFGLGDTPPGKPTGGAEPEPSGPSATTASGAGNGPEGSEPTAEGDSEAEGLDPEEPGSTGPDEPGSTEQETADPGTTEPGESEPETEAPESPEPEPDGPEEPAGGDVDGACPVCGEQTDETYCPVCGTHIDRTCHVCGTDAPGQAYCPECGTELVRTCDVCGAQFSGDEQYCSRCGTER